jgi:predicted phage-related endonuclease
LAPDAHVVLPAGDLYDPDYRARWLEERQKGLGGSDLGKLLGFSGCPWDVYLDKHGRGTDFDTEAMLFGREFEAPIARIFTHYTGIPLIQPPGMYANNQRPWMLANLDRLAYDPDTLQVEGPVECKNRSEFVLRDWEEDEAPEAPAIQDLWYQMVGGWRVGWVAAAVGGNKLRWHKVEYREDLAQHLVEWTEEWWTRHIVEGEEPPPDGLPGTKGILAHLWDVTEDAVTEVAVEQARNLQRRYNALDEAIKRAERRRDEVGNTMRLILRGNEVAKTPGKRVAFTNKQNGPFASSRFKAGEPELAEKYTVMVPAIDTEALAADHPLIYRKYRARVLRVPKRGI